MVRHGDTRVGGGSAQPLGAETVERGEASIVDSRRRTLRVVPARERKGSGHRAEGVAEHRATVAVGLADVRRLPDVGSELVTQAYLGTSARCGEVHEDWTHVRLPDYVGWVRTSQLGAPSRWRARVVVVTARRAPIYVACAGDAVLDHAYIGTVAPLVRWANHGSGRRVEFELAVGKFGWLAYADVAVRPTAQPFPPAYPEVALDLARSLRGTPYVWGGTTPDGIDCSGLSQLSYRVAGHPLPRDADQQFQAVSYLVERADLRPGDLVFFAVGGQIVHVGLSLGGERLVHASSVANCVTTGSLDPADEGYSPWLAARYAGARRPMPFPPEPVADGPNEV